MKIRLSISLAFLELFLNEKPVIFMTNQGYLFLYFQSEAHFDAPIYQYIEGQAEPKQVADGFVQSGAVRFCEDKKRSGAA